MAKLLLVPLLLLCVSAASGQRVSKDTNSSEIVLTCRPQNPLSHTWICVDQFGKERTNLIIKDKETK